MTGPLGRWRARQLNLDAPDGKAEASSNPQAGPSTKDVWRLIRRVLLACLQRNASALHFFRDERDGYFRLLYCVTRGGDIWHEMTAPPTVAGPQIIDLLRRRCRLRSDRPEGTLRYIYRSALRKARCMSGGVADLRIYFGAHRPRVLDRDAGEKPGVPIAPF